MRVFLTRIEEKDYLVGYMPEKSIGHAHAVVKISLSKVDAYDQKFKRETWVKGIESDLIIDLTRTPNESGIA